jgi:hypothetical protein
MLRKTKRSLSMLLAIMLVWTLFSGLGSAAQGSRDDLDGHWAESDLRKWVESGLLKGYEDGTYRPNQVVTRAELVTLINRSFELTKGSSSSFNDVLEGDWTYEQIGIAVEAEYVKGYEDGSFRPNREVTREEAAYMLSALLQIEQVSLDVLKPFMDAAGLSSAGKQVLANLVDTGILKGTSIGQLDPKGGLTRAQAVTILEAALVVANPTITYDQPGVYGPESGKETIKGNVIIAAADVTLQNVIITGDLTVTSAVGEGDAFFKGITVEGDSFIQGGGPNSIHFEDSVLVRISVDKRDGSVRLVVAGQSAIRYVVVNSPVKLEESFVTDSGISNVELSDALPSGSQVELLGQFENVDVLSSNIKVKIPSGSIGTLNVQSGVSGNDIELSKDASILKLVLDSVAKLLGEGKIENAIVNEGAEGSDFERQPEKVEGPGAVAPTPTPVPVIVNPGPVATPTPTPTPTEKPTETEGPAPTTCTDDGCKVALLEGLAVGEYELAQIGSSDNTPTGETGFDPDVFKYSVVHQVVDPTAVSLTVALSTYSTASYSISQGIGPNASWSSGTVSDNAIEVTLKPKQDNVINITVKSGDGLRSKFYTVVFHYPRSMQESFKLSFSSGYDQPYMLSAQLINGDPLLNTDLIEVYRTADAETPINLGYDSSGYKRAYIMKRDLISEKGTLYIRVKRDGKLLHEGPYAYDVTPLTNLNVDIGYSIVQLTKQELIDKVVNNPAFTTPFSHGVEYYWDPEILKAAVPDAKYYMTYDERLMDTRTEWPDQMVQDQVKIGTVAEGFSSHMLSSVRNIPFHTDDEIYVGGVYTHYSEQGSRIVYDNLYYVVLFDEELKAIGYVVIPVQFSEATVADGYTVEHTWQPAIIE